MLPQGDFATFLQASVGQRQDILLKLLGARHYDAIGRLAGRRANDARARLDALTGELAGYADATEEAETAARQREVELVALLATVTDDVAAVARLSTEREVAAAAAARANEELARLDRGGRSRRHRRAAAGPDGGRGRLPGGERRRSRRPRPRPSPRRRRSRSGPPRSWLDETLRWHARAGRRAAGLLAAATGPRSPAGWGWSGPPGPRPPPATTLETVRAEHDRRPGGVRAGRHRGHRADRADRRRALGRPARRCRGPGRRRRRRPRTVAGGPTRAGRRRGDAHPSPVDGGRAAGAECAHRPAAHGGGVRDGVDQLAALRTRVRTVDEQERRGRGGGRPRPGRRTRRAAEELEGVRSQSVAADLRPHLQVGHACPVCTQTVSRAAAATVRARAGRRPGRSA